MASERLKQIEKIYHAALEIPPAERESFFKISCGADAELRREVESLLSFENASDSLIDTPPESLAAEMLYGRAKNLKGKKLGHYKILSLLGKGGMGAVYLAEDSKLDRKIAVKLLSKEFGRDTDKLNRFVREAKAASALNHPNILTVYEIGEVGGINYIATEFIDGKVLSRHNSKEKLTLESVLDISIQIVSALQTAHEAGIVHRDIKPDNLMLRKDGIVKVLDFGLAKLSEKQSANESDSEAAAKIAKSITNPGIIIGTPNYMSPEQARGKGVTHQTDIFSFGIVLYEMLSGKLPFQGESAMDTIGAILHKEPFPINQLLPELPLEIEQIVNKALCKNTGERYQNTKDLLVDLRSVKQRLDYENVGRSFPPENSKADLEAQETKIFDSSDFSQIISMENAPPNNLSGEPLLLIGRDDETAEIMKLLRQPNVRLLTITGVGGTGKTRLANTISHLSLAEFADGVYYVALAPIDNHELVASVIAQALGVRQEAGKTLIEALGEHLGEKKMLIVLDNFEQIKEAAPQISELLSRSPDLKILVTSRVRLNLKLEREFTLQPLGVPADERFTAKEFGEYPAVELFVKRAKAAKSDFALTEENAASIAEICRRLDGLPLAIELAAARVKLFAPAAILKRLENSLNFLTGGAKDLPERQQTMRGAIAWSYDLLDAEEKKLLSRLSVFRGGLTLEGAEAVGNAQADLNVDLLDVVSSLVDKSLLLQRQQADGEPRFRMLVVVREFAFEKLAERGEADEIKRRHTTFYTAFSEKAGAELNGADAAQWYEKLEQEHDNIRAALRWTLDNEPAAALRIAVANYSFWVRHGYLAEGCKWMTESLEKSGEDADPKLRAEVNRKVSYLFRQHGDFAAANLFGEEGLRLGRQIGDKTMIAFSLGALGVIKTGEGDFKSARKFSEESLAIAEEINDQKQIGNMLNSLGEIARGEEDYPAARKFYEDALKINRQVSSNFAQYNISNLACINYLLGDYQSSRRYSLEVLKLNENFGNKIIVAQAIDALAAVALKDGKPEKAARLSGAAATIYESIGHKQGKVDQEFNDRYINETRAAIGEEAFAAVFAEGRSMPMKEAIALARENEPDWQSDSAKETHITDEAVSGTKNYSTNDSLKARTATFPPIHTTIPDASPSPIFLSRIWRKSVFLRALIILLAAAAAAGGGFFGYRYLTADRQIKSIAVLPFVNVGDDRDSEYLADGLSENLINTLSRLPQLKVIARSSSFKFRGENIDVQDAAQKLGVATILTGRVARRGGDDLQISVELINAADNTRIWGDIYNRKVSGALSVQEEIAQAVSEKLQLNLSGAQERQMAKQMTNSPQAYQAYMNGVFFRRKNGAENIRKAIEYQKQSIALDANFARAFTELSISFAALVEIGALSPQEGLPQARAAAEKALALDETLAEAHYTIARVRDFEFDQTGAESAFKRAIELNSNLAGAHTLYAEYLSRSGRFDEALREVKRAQELDPLRTGLVGNEGLILYYARRYDEAIAKKQIHAQLAADNPFAHLELANAYVQKGQYAEAILSYQTSIKLEETTSALIYLGRVYALSGKRGEAIAILNKLKTTEKYVSPTELAILYAALGDKEKAFASLEKAYTERDFQLTSLKVEPAYDPLRDDRRFQELIQKIGFPQ